MIRTARRAAVTIALAAGTTWSFTAQAFAGTTWN